ncbi:uncharacterized protein LOC117901124 [Drosophila subobscura]|uniref:uncharacterized protein LOC117901124 n=1 Tax=Drosophila subobscura TaxID=7241 RepID=UPI00155A6F28|nr:uncharacterized protein LOC117901124 [Drosophila subobscura]
MIRLYKLYSLFLKTMDNANTDNLALVQEWCYCEKLPRAALHIPLNPNLRCDVCGLERRAKPDPSSSDEEEAADNELQKMLLERRRVEEALHGAARVKGAMRVKKPCSMHNCKNCIKCGGMPKPRAKEFKTKDNSDCLEHLPKPIEVLPEWRRGVQIPERDPTPTATPSTSPSSEKSAQHAFESMWEPSPEASQSTRGKRLVSRRLGAPITDPSGGAISKRGRFLRTRPSRPLQPLSKVLASTLAEKEEPNARAKGGGLSRDLMEDGNPFPFEYYEGPSEDALVVDSALSMLQQPMALHMKPVQRLPLPCPTISSTGSDEGAISASPKPLDKATPPVARRSSTQMQTDITKATSLDSSNSGAIKTPDLPRKKYSLLEIKIMQMMKGLRLISSGHAEVAHQMSIDHEVEAAILKQQKASVVLPDEGRMTQFCHGNVPATGETPETRLGRRIRREHSLERRFNVLVKSKFDTPKAKSEAEQRREYLLKMKLEEMMTKPIQLLSPDEERSGQ